jgi:hypothetical protein
MQIELAPGTYYLRVAGYGVTHPDAGDGRVSVRITPLPRIDVIPSQLNPFNRGVIPVAIVGNEYFDIAQIDLASLNFGPAEAVCRHDLTDEWTYNEHLDDVNFDGYMDLMLHFNTQDTGIACGDTEATLIGALSSGVPFEGTDSIRTVGCHRSSGLRNALRDSDRIQRIDARVIEPELEDSDGEE